MTARFHAPAAVTETAAAARKERTFLFVFLVAAWPAWAMGGTSLIWLRPLALLSLAALFLVAAEGQRDRLVQDPVVLLLAGVLALSFVQWLNAGRELFFDPAAGQWGYTAPPVAFLPGAITAAGGEMVLIWFLALAAVVVGISHGLSRRRTIRRLAWLLPLHAHLVTAAWLYHHIAVGWRMETPPAGAGPGWTGLAYANHAAAFFMLLFFWTAGWCLHARQQGRRGAALAWGGLLVPCLAAVHLTGCRAVILMIWGSLAGIGLFRLLRRGGAPVRFLLLLVVLGTGVVLLPGVGPRPAEVVMRPALHWLAAADGTLSGHWTDRQWQARAAWRIFRDHPWLGAGGNSYAYLAPLYMTPQQAAARNTPGRAFVHNDPLQFLSEFGLLGCGGLVGILVLLVTPVIRGIRMLPGFLRPALAGVLLTGLYSLVDLPLRCPAVLVTAAAILAMAARWTMLGPEDTDAPAKSAVRPDSPEGQPGAAGPGFRDSGAPSSPYGRQT